jgi:hypothetical protein
VKVGIKSRPGMISSIKLNTPPKNPLAPPNIRINTSAEIGAQTISRNSPRKGIPYVAYPKKSISRQAAREGIGFSATGTADCF